ncbi:hypothetical protein [Plantibacter sp. RU18]|uniref:hypothetical protein n=1 Tax=Plantibacter sp. RU18 TaxID=3158143 RepID=UPI003D36552E
MATITPEYIDEQIDYLRTEHEFYIVYDEFGGDERDLAELRRLLRRAAKAASMRVHRRVYEDDAVWVYDPDWNPAQGEREAIHWERSPARSQPAAADVPARGRHLRALN